MTQPTEAAGEPVSLPAATDFSSVTEIVGSPVSAEQVERLCNRYFWAATYCHGKDVVEVGCGTGPGLGYLASVSKSLEAGDYSNRILEHARRHYGERVPLRQFDAQAMPYSDRSKDLIVLFEALYYVPDADRFVGECRRVLRAGGTVLIASANKDLWDFHPSPHSHRYYGVVELGDLFRAHGFEAKFFGYQAVRGMPLRQRVLRPVKRLAVRAGLIPKTMAGKRWLKRIVFGAQQTMPAEITATSGHYQHPMPLSPGAADRAHKIIYCAATLLER